MDEDIFSRIEHKMPSLSKGQRRIAALIHESCDKTAFMTACSLGKQAGVSESTVVRFAVELGYDGYPQMQKEMQKMVLNRLTTEEEINSQDIVSAVLRSDAEKLFQTDRNLDRKAFQKAVEHILKAKKVYILGNRSASPLAEFCGYYMRYMFDSVCVITNCTPGDVLEHLINITEQDAVLVFSFPQYATATLQGAAYCRSIGAAVIGITNSFTSPLAPHCDYLLVANSEKMSMIDSLVAPFSVVNALLVTLAAEKEETLRTNFEKLNHIWDIHHIYEKKDGNT